MKEKAYFKGTGLSGWILTSSRDQKFGTWDLDANSALHPLRAQGFLRFSGYSRCSLANKTEAEVWPPFVTEDLIGGFAPTVWDANHSTLATVQAG